MVPVFVGSAILNGATRTCRIRIGTAFVRADTWVEVGVGDGGAYTEWKNDDQVRRTQVGGGEKMQRVKK